MRICGLDEVGRGALAGPLVAAAAIFNSQIPNLKDSKKLNARQRDLLYKIILENAEIKIEIISARLINNRGIGWANREVFKKLIKKIKADKYIVDGNLRIKSAISMVKADTKIPEVMAASIIAKVTRDNLMKELHKKHPHYGWMTNVGYGTSYHIRTIREFGTVHYHRNVFVTTALKNEGEVNH